MKLTKLHKNYRIGKHEGERFDGERGEGECGQARFPRGDADRVLPEGIDRVVNTVRIDDDGTHGVLPSSQNTETKIVNVVRPTALESSEEPDMYAGMYDIYVTSDNSIDQSEIFIPVISRHLFKDLESQSMTIGEYWTIQGCYFLTEALRGRSELMQRPNMSEWYSYCSVVSGQGEE